MKVKFHTSVAGTNFGYMAHREYELADDFALGFVRAGLASPVEAVTQLAVAPDAERMAVLPSRKTKR